MTTRSSRQRKSTRRVLVAEQYVAVDLRLRQPGLGAELAVTGLELAGRDVGAQVAAGQHVAEAGDASLATRPSEQVLHLAHVELVENHRLVARALELRFTEEGGEAEEGRRDTGDGDAVELGHVGRRQIRVAMDADAGTGDR